jgi:signal transduction histidine kinase
VSLLSNAAQALPDGKGVRVVLEEVEGSVRIAVEDEGEGMTPEAAARAFEPFFTTRPGVGIGLGLAIVKGIVDRHGGAVAIESAAGKGTAVTVTLPVRRRS